VAQEARNFSSLSSIDQLAADSTMDTDLIECLISSLESNTDDAGKTIDSLTYFDNITNNMDFDLLSQFLASPLENSHNCISKPFTFEQAVEELLLPPSPESLSQHPGSIMGTDDSLSGCSDLLSLSDDELFGDAACPNWDDSLGDLFPSLNV